MPFRRKTIVIVEDEKDTAEMFAEMIRLNGFQVINAYSGAQAISQIASNKPDLVVIDLMIPTSPAWTLSSKCSVTPA